MDGGMVRSGGTVLDAFTTRITSKGRGAFRNARIADANGDGKADILVDMDFYISPSDPSSPPIPRASSLHEWARMLVEVRDDPPHSNQFWQDRRVDSVRSCQLRKQCSHEVFHALGFANRRPLHFTQST